VALSFVGLVWVLITLLAASRAWAVGWPVLLTDAGVLLLGITSAVLLLVVVVKRDEILGETITVVCPNCGASVKRAQFAVWQLIAVICLFPIGLLSLLAGYQATVCPDCRHTWQP
jgi:hypothetical protein